VAAHVLLSKQEMVQSSPQSAEQSMASWKLNPQPFPHVPPHMVM